MERQLPKDQNDQIARATPRRGAKKLGVIAIASALMMGSLVAALPAQAAAASVEDAVFSWGINHESGGGAYFGGCNFLAAGEAGDSGSARVWTEADGFFKTSDGDVTVVKPDATGELVQPTWSQKCTNRNGTSIGGRTSGLTFTSGGVVQPTYSETQVQIAHGTGTVDAETDTAEITWQGSFTIAYYGGMTYWTVTDPHLSVHNGKGLITATFSGYGADMDNPEIWEKLEPRVATLADFQGSTVDVTDNGFQVVPDYLGVVSEGEGRNPQAVKTTTNEPWWGAFPSSWIDFNIATGQDSYWYTTEGVATSIQPRKPTQPLAVHYTSTIVPTPSLTASALPKVSGTAAVGKTLTATTGTWQPADASYSAQWLRNGVAISGATKSKYTLSSSDVGKKISIRITASKTGYLGADAISGSTKAVVKGKFAATRPVIRGTAKAGRTLKVAVKAWTPKASSVKYRWYVNGKAIPRATKNSYTIPAKFVGKRLSVKVAGARTGYNSLVTASIATAAVKR